MTGSSTWRRFSHRRCWAVSDLNLPRWMICTPGLLASTPRKPHHDLFRQTTHVFKQDTGLLQLLVQNAAAMAVAGERAGAHREATGHCHRTSSSLPKAAVCSLNSSAWHISHVPAKASRSPQSANATPAALGSRPPIASAPNCSGRSPLARLAVSALPTSCHPRPGYSIWPRLHPDRQCDDIDVSSGSPMHDVT